MLLRIRVANHASIRDELEINLIADRHRADRAEAVVPLSEHHVVSAVGIYGANASGKSNVLGAIAMTRAQQAEQATTLAVVRSM